MPRFTPSIGSAFVALALVAAPAAAQASHDTMEKSMAMRGDLRVAFNALFAEHVWLAAAATGAALQGGQAGFAAAAAALDSNSVALADAVGRFHGQAARGPFLALWRRHIGFVVDYTTALAAKDKPKQDQAVSDLLGYTNDLAAFLHSAHPSLPTATLADLVKGHILTLKSVIDLQARGDWAGAYVALRSAAAHMQMIGDPLATDLANKAM
jgi:hypothetical protein